MELYVNQTSPYARKVRVVVREKQLDERVTLIEVDPWSDAAALLAVTPLSRVPAMVAGDNIILTESDAICRYLDDGWPVPPMMPADDAGRGEANARIALVQGMIDSAFDAAIELRRPAECQWPDWIARQRRAIERGMGVVATWPRPDDRFDLGDVSLACLLGYLDFRHPGIAWRMKSPVLAAWFDEVSRRPSLADTAPGMPVLPSVAPLE